MFHEQFNFRVIVNYYQLTYFAKHGFNLPNQTTNSNYRIRQLHILL